MIQLTAMYLVDRSTLNIIRSFDEFGMASYMITDLQSRNKYTLRIEYVYDYSENTTSNYVLQYNFTTDSGIEIFADGLTSTYDSFSFYLVITDPDSVLYISGISVKIDGKYLDDVPQLGPYYMDGLDPDTEYIIEIDYSFPIRNDNYEYVTGTLIIRITTQPLPDTVA